MNTRTSNALLAIIAAALIVIAARPYLHPDAVVHADTQSFDPLYIEPGVSMLRVPNGGQVLGKIVVNLRTGNITGYPTGTTDNYPVTPIDNKPQTSHGIPLGRFAFNDAK